MQLVGGPWLQGKLAVSDLRRVGNWLLLQEALPPPGPWSPLLTP